MRIRYRHIYHQQLSTHCRNHLHHLRNHPGVSCTSGSIPLCRVLCYLVLLACAVGPIPTAASCWVLEQIMAFLKQQQRVWEWHFELHLGLELLPGQNWFVEGGVCYFSTHAYNIHEWGCFPRCSWRTPALERALRALPHLIYQLPSVPFHQFSLSVSEGDCLLLSSQACHPPLLVMDVHLSRKSSLIQPWVRPSPRKPLRDGWLVTFQSRPSQLLTWDIYGDHLYFLFSPSKVCSFKVEPLDHFSLYPAVPAHLWALSNSLPWPKAMMTLNYPLLASQLPLIWLLVSSSVCTPLGSLT